MFKEFDVVRLKRPVPEEGLPAGIEGTVLIVYDYAGLPRAYEVEFTDDAGDTIAVVAIKEDFLEKV